MLHPGYIEGIAQKLPGPDLHTPKSRKALYVIQQIHELGFDAPQELFDLIQGEMKTVADAWWADLMASVK